MTAPATLWAAITLFLLVVWLVQRLPGVRGTFGLLLAVVIGLAAVFNGWSGPSLPFWLGGLNAQTGAVMAALLVIGICQRAGLGELFRPREWRAAWIFGCVAALLLYPSALGLGWRSFDVYSLGWPWLEWVGSLLLFGPVAVTAGMLVGRGNRFGWVLALASAFYLVRAFESHNFWDYLMDPLYGSVSLAVVFWQAGRRWLGRRA